MQGLPFMKPGGFVGFFTMGIMACLLLVPVPAAAQALVREYFVRQGVDEALLIRVDGIDAQFSAVVLDIDGGVVTSGGVIEHRLGPLFLYVPETSRDRQLDIRVAASRSTDRTRFNMGLNRIGVRDQRSATLDRAYRMLAYSLQPPAVDTAANWSVKAGSLSSAAGIFADFGMDELRLWSRYFQAHITAIGMGDSATALGLLAELRDDVALSRFPEVGLALAWLTLRLAPPERDPGATLEAANQVLEQPAISRQPLAMAEARLSRAEALVALDRLGDGMGEYQVALAQADRIGAGDLSTQVRERLVELHGQSGDAIATGEVLREIESRLDAEGQGDELAQNLLAQGRLLNDAWRFAEAERVLDQAMALQRNSATEAQVRLELARAALATGRFSTARSLAEAAARAPDGNGWRRQTPLLDVGLALGIMADSDRQLGRFKTMQEARRAQGERLTGPAARDAWDYARILDALAAPGATADAAVPIERLRSRTASPWSGLAQLQHCRLEGGCTAAVAARALAQSRATGRAAISVEAAERYADWQAASGQGHAALATREALVREVRGLQRAFPGVIDAWCWQRCTDMLDAYVDALMADATPEQAQLGLARVRLLSDEGGSVPAAAAVDPSRLTAREDLRLAAAGDAAASERAAATLAATRSEVESSGSGAVSHLADWREKLGDSAAVLDFHLGKSAAWLLVTDGRGTHRFRLEQGGALARDVAAIPERLAVDDLAGLNTQMARLGQRLLGPVAGELPERLYWLGAGPLSVLAPAALRINDRYLAERHILSTPLSFPLAPPPAAAGAVERGMFLAGAPESFQAGYLATLAPAPELDAVASLFVGPGLQVIRGAALLPDEFQTEAFRQAPRVHLATPANIDWPRAGDSWIELSEPPGGGGRERLAPADLSGLSTRAATLFLGQSIYMGEPPTPFSLRPPLVAQWLAAGAEAVPATLWPGETADSVAFLERFYRTLADDPDAAVALTMAMRDAIARQAAPGAWARYRLYTP